MLPFPQINPIALSIGPLQFRWYGIMYLLGFLSGWALGRYRAIKSSQSGGPWTVPMVDDMVTYIIMGVVLGGRIGYVLFYDLTFYAQNPLELFSIWNGGMSFHGGLLGVVLAMWLLGRRFKMTFLQVADFVAPLIAPGIFFGRIGNFINGELWGGVSNVPWAMIFPTGGNVARHPSQLYEAFFEGFILFVAVWYFSSKKRPEGAVAALFAMLYAIFRFGVEFIREPDAHIGYLAFGWLTMGQLLCVPLILLGAFVLCRSYMKAAKNI